MNINIKTIKNRHQRYPTVGDYWFENDGDIQIRISNMGNTDYEFLVAIHELIECYLTKKRGISEESITAFDMKFEEERKDTMHRMEDEPGYDPRAPYKNEHFFAEAIERLLANQLGVDWKTYNDSIMIL